MRSLLSLARCDRHQRPRIVITTGVKQSLGIVTTWEPYFFLRPSPPHARSIQSSTQSSASPANEALSCDFLAPSLIAPAPLLFDRHPLSSSFVRSLVNRASHHTLSPFIFIRRTKGVDFLSPCHKPPEQLLIFDTTCTTDTFFHSSLPPQPTTTSSTCCVTLQSARLVELVTGTASSHHLVRIDIAQALLLP